MTGLRVVDVPGCWACGEPAAEGEPVARIVFTVPAPIAGEIRGFVHMGCAAALVEELVGDDRALRGDGPDREEALRAVREAWGDRGRG